MAIEHAWLLKGWLLAKDAPPPIMEAIEAVIEECQGAVIEITCRPDVSIPAQLPPIPEYPENGSLPDAEPEKKTRKPWSEERKAKQSEVMRATQARLKQEKQSPGEAQAPSKAGA